MGDQLAPQIFLSYASDDAWWIDLFRKYFGPVGNVSISDYRADNVAFGPLSSALNERIGQSAVVLAFVSNTYRQKKWTVAEWENGLADVARRRLIFVPIMMDADGIAWWKELRRNQKLTNLTRDYQYADFSAGAGPALPGPDSPHIIQRINTLALKIRDDLAQNVQVRPTEGLPTGAPPTDTKFVILGHPTASLPADLQTDSQGLIDTLGVAATSWKDGWRRKEAARSSLAEKADPVFVQPVAETEAADYVEEKARTEKYLTELGRPKSRVALWLPANYPNAEFEKAASDYAAAERAGGENFLKYPALRRDTPAGLAEWLRADIEQVHGDATVVQVEGLGTADGGKAENVAAAKLVVDRLKDAIWDIVIHVVQQPPPASPAWQFWDTQFGQQIKILPGSRAIVAVHDLDIPPHSDDRVVRKKVEHKFDRIHRDIEAEQVRRQENGKPRLNLFWTALLVNNAEALPFSNYPGDGRYKDWRLLGFTPVAGGSDGSNGPVPVAPDPASLAVFRTNLLAWTVAP